MTGTKVVRWAIASTALIMLTVAASGDSTAADASVNVVHGIPGQDLGQDPALPVDVLVDNEHCVLRAITFGQVLGPIPLSPGTHNFKISMSDYRSPCGNTPDLDFDFDFEEGEKASVVAHLTADGDATVSKFANELSGFRLPIVPRIVLHHTAALPALDVAVRRSLPDSPGLVVLGFSNGDQSMRGMRGGEWQGYFTQAGTNVILFGPVDITLNQYTATLLYLVGSAENGTLTLISKDVFLRLRPPVIRWPDRRERRHLSTQRTLR
jgi:hypothetical protein